MSKNISVAAVQSFHITVILTETEARCLNALFGYGADSLLEASLKMGTTYMMDATNSNPRPVMQSLFNKFYNELPNELRRIRACRDALAQP